ncbi:MAG: DUF547 domain-containing protein [Winogradskyella arenosi]
MSSIKYLSAILILVGFSTCGAKNLQEQNTLQQTAVQLTDKTTPVVNKNTAILKEEAITLPPKAPLPSKTDSTTAETFNHSRWDRILQKHVSNSGEVNYEALKNDPSELNIYIDALTHNTPTDAWTKEAKLAYWINAYNALTIDLILKNYPVKSIKDIKNPWDQKLWQFGDTWQDLNTIEHKILRPMKEPRIHFAIVCASISCPKLQNKAFTASTLETQLTQATKEFLNDPTKNELTKDAVQLSRIFKWFKKDFEITGSLIQFLNQYTDFEISESAKANYKDYNWNLNN